MISFFNEENNSFKVDDINIVIDEVSSNLATRDERHKETNK